jgi:outer membrane protein OmpA-like peptidoglycan-associated protein
MDKIKYVIFGFFVALSFILPKGIFAQSKIPHVLVCEVIDQITKKNIQNAEIVIRKIDHSIERSLKVDEFGKIKIEIPEGHLYYIKAYQNQYFSSERKEYSTITTLPGITDLRLFLKPITIGSLISFQLNYAPNEDKIDESNEAEATYILDFLTENINIAVELSAHTDARGDAAYNLALTQKRADNLKKYLLEKGILANRILAKGYGETRPLNQCSDNVKCSTDEHLVNRRIELVVLAIWN